MPAGSIFSDAPPRPWLGRPAQDGRETQPGEAEHAYPDGRGVMIGLLRLLMALSLGIGLGYTAHLMGLL